jgi:hypothetical protein
MSRMFGRLRIAAIVFHTAAAFCIGCGGAAGPELAEVTGKVSLDGQALAKVSLQFIPEGDTGSPSYGVTNAEGEYELLFSAERSGAMVGKYQVEIQPIEPDVDQDGKPLDGAVPVVIPARYQTAGALTAEVKPGSNSIDFALVSE